MLFQIDIYISVVLLVMSWKIMITKPVKLVSTGFRVLFMALVSVSYTIKI